MVNERRRQRLERLWVVGVVAYSVLRIVVAKATVERYGVNIWAFGAIDLVSSVPYGFSTARVVTSIIDKRTEDLVRWGSIAAASFIAPDLYVVIAGRTMPLYIYLVIGTWVTLMATLGVREIRKRVRAMRATRRFSEPGS